MTSEPIRRACWLLLALSLLPAQAADVFRLDAANTRISFNIQHFGVLWFSARFPDFSGDLVLDRRGAASRVEISRLRCPDPAAAGESCSFVAHALIRRSDYGLAHGFWIGGDQVEIAIS